MFCYIYFFLYRLYYKYKVNMEKKIEEIVLAATEAEQQAYDEAMLLIDDERELFTL